MDCRVTPGNDAGVCDIALLMPHPRHDLAVINVRIRRPLRAQKIDADRLRLAPDNGRREIIRLARNVRWWCRLLCQ